MQNRKDKFEPNTCYHIYNRAVGNEQLFKSDKNYRYFLEKYRKYISPVADTIAYCLLPNHFHFLVRLKEFAQVSPGRSPTRVPNPRRAKEIQYSMHISRCFSNLFNAYAQAFNKQEKRNGSLFKNRFKHIALTGDDYLVNLIQYIHLNPVHHAICENHSDWKFSSFNAILSNRVTRIDRETTLSLFDNRENFIYCHNHKKFILSTKYMLEN